MSASVMGFGAHRDMDASRREPNGPSLHETSREEISERQKALIAGLQAKLDSVRMREERVAAMEANLKLEVEAREKRLRELLNAQAENALAKGERRVARVPNALRNLKLADLLAPAVATATEAKPQTTTAPQPVTTAKPLPAKKTTTRKTRAPATVPIAPRLRTAKRSAKRSSDEMESENKENAQDANKKRVRAKPTTTARATRATSRQNAVLSPKSGNSATTKKPTTRPR